MMLTIVMLIIFLVAWVEFLIGRVGQLGRRDAGRCLHLVLTHAAFSFYSLCWLRITDGLQRRIWVILCHSAVTEPQLVAAFSIQSIKEGVCSSSRLKTFSEKPLNTYYLPGFTSVAHVCFISADSKAVRVDRRPYPHFGSTGSKVFAQPCSGAASHQGDAP